MAPRTLPRQQPTQSGPITLAAPAPQQWAITPPQPSQPSGDTAALPEQAIIVVAVEGEQTADLRIVESGALTWRDLPMSLTRNHDPNQIIGRIDEMGRVDSVDGLTVATFAPGATGAYVVALVTFDLGLDAAGNLVDPNALGREAARQVVGGFLLGVSMEVGNEEIEWECIAEDETDEGAPYCVEYLMRLLAGRIGAVTLTPFQAIESARAVDTDIDTEQVVAEAERITQEAAIAASAAGPRWYTAPSPFSRRTPRPRSLVARGAPALLRQDLSKPAAEWFADPQLEEPTPLQVTADGLVFGHIAAWGTCHIARTDVCITPPHSEADYAYFRTGECLCADGTSIPVGKYTYGIGHADIEVPEPGGTWRPVSAQEAIAHYDSTDTQAALLAAGEDAHGIWVAGYVHGNLDRNTLAVLRAAAPSGDWRRIAVGLELVGVLAVNVPGFPIPKTRTLVASGGEQLALVAAPAPTAITAAGCGCGSTKAATGSMAELERRLARSEAIIAALGLEDQAVSALAASIGR